MGKYSSDYNDDTDIILLVLKLIMGGLVLLLIAVIVAFCQPMKQEGFKIGTVYDHKYSPSHRSGKVHHSEEFRLFVVTDDKITYKIQCTDHQYFATSDGKRVTFYIYRGAWWGRLVKYELED